MIEPIHTIDADELKQVLNVVMGKGVILGIEYGLEHSYQDTMNMLDYYRKQFGEARESAYENQSS